MASSRQPSGFPLLEIQGYVHLIKRPNWEQNANYDRKRGKKLRKCYSSERFCWWRWGSWSPPPLMDTHTHTLMQSHTSCTLFLRFFCAPKNNTQTHRHTTPAVGFHYCSSFPLLGLWCLDTHPSMNECIIYYLQGTFCAPFFILSCHLHSALSRMHQCISKYVLRNTEVRFRIACCPTTSNESKWCNTQ